MSVFDECVKIISAQGKAPRITFNAGHIAVGAQRKNFAWFTPRTRIAYCRVDLRVGENNISSALERFNQAGIDCRRDSGGVISIKLKRQELDANKVLITDLLRLGIAEGGGL